MVHGLLEECLPLQHAVQLVSLAIRTMNYRFMSKIDLSHAQVIKISAGHSHVILSPKLSGSIGR